MHQRIKIMANKYVLKMISLMSKIENAGFKVFSHLYLANIDVGLEIVLWKSNYLSQWEENHKNKSSFLLVCINASVKWTITTWPPGSVLSTVLF